MYGDAIWETSSQAGLPNYVGWAEDGSDADKAYGEPFFLRGGNMSFNKSSGIFTFADHSGIANDFYSTRVVIVVE